MPLCGPEVARKLGQIIARGQNRHDWADGYAGALHADVRARICQPGPLSTRTVLESAFRRAVRWRMLAEDPCAGVDLPHVKRKEMEALSVEERRRFLSTAQESEWYALFALALTTGMRPRVPSQPERISRH